MTDSNAIGKTVIILKMGGYLTKWLFGRNSAVEGQYSYHRRSAAMPLTFMLFFILPTGVFLVGIILPWTWVTWLLGAGAFYIFFFTVSLYASMVALPHTLNEKDLILRFGALASGTIPLGNIESAAINREWLGQSGDGLKMDLAESTACFSVGSATSIKLSLRQPLRLQFWSKETKPVTTVYFHADDPEKMINAINYRLSGDMLPAVETR